MNKYIVTLILLLFAFGGESQIANASNNPIIHQSKFTQKEFERIYTFPEKIAALSKIHTKNFEQDYPGIGYAVSYRGENDTHIDIYLYDLQLLQVPSNMNSQVAIDVFKGILKDLAKMEENGTYQNYKYTDGQLIDLGGHATWFSNLEYTSEGSQKYSYLLFTELKGKFLKVRATTLYRVDNSHKTILDDLTKLIANEIISKNSLPEESNEKQKAKAQIQLYEHMSNEQAAAWIIYAYALIEWDKDNKPTSCGFERELNARNKAIEFWVNLKKKNKLIRDEQLDAMLLSQMDNFLKEFIWVYFIDPSCEQPQPLSLEEFGKWRAKNLNGYQPVTRAIVKYK